ncbi:hypothetical protein SAMN06265222_1109 [Neorhodopirellula lusitana]|uniref:Secreted protein n=1 Tax=Neorhodopirellula lusitana TaxID=445327 RepID=A0ABY1QBF2_9BACT|nr:hypothetical protein [Neorhodopirellula lusitana]SMP66526.1 hypothetical protein SAMN06265222_1109 [Neorhodopirellula lusitana]
MQVRTYALVAGMLLTFGVVGCEKTEPQKTYSTSDVEQLLQEHPELAEPRQGAPE